jgi:hypothetical protein
MPMGIGNPEEVAHAVVFCFARRKFITGAVLDIDGTIRGLIQSHLATERAI